MDDSPNPSVEPAATNNSAAAKKIERKQKPVNNFALASFFILAGTFLLFFFIANYGYAAQLVRTPDYGDFSEWWHRNGTNLIIENPVSIPTVVISIVFAHLAITKSRRHLWGTPFAIITLIAGYLLVLAGIILFLVGILLLISIQNFQF